MKTKIMFFIFICLGVFTKAYAQPQANFSWTSNCLQVSFTDISTCNGCTIVSWEWNFGDGIPYPQQNPVYFFWGEGMYAVTLFVTDNNNNTDDTTLFVYVNPFTGNFQINISITSLCVIDECTPVVSEVTGGNPPYLYQWEVNSTTIPGASQPELLLCPDYQSGNYSLSVVDGFGCINSSNILEIGDLFMATSNFENEICGFSNGLAEIAVTGSDDPIAYLWSPGGETTSSISGLSEGLYSVVITDTSGCVMEKTFNISDMCGFILGNVFYDSNNNNIYDTNEFAFIEGNIISSGDSIYEIQLDNEGLFNVYVGQGNFITNFIPYLDYYSISPSDHLSIINNTNDTVSFAVTPIPGNPDLQIFINPASAARPGFDASYQLIAKNVGTDTLSGSVRFGIDSRLSFVSSNPNYDSFQNDTMNWNFIDFAPLETMIYNVVLHVPEPTNVNIGDILSFSAVIYPVQVDMVPLDNYDELRQTVIGSYDPNDKWVSDEWFLYETLGDYLNYRIRFQNTGTDTAFTISVRDTLDSNLDWSTLQMINASHDYTLSIRGSNALEWKFENILLPDSNTNEALSHGYIFYRIKPKNTLFVGDSIANSAAIYFDYNQPVITNTAYTEVYMLWSVSENTFNATLDIFPNPSPGKFTVQFLYPGSGNFTFELTDVSGRLLESQTFFHENKTELRPQLKLAKGVYLVYVFNEFGRVTRKLIIR